ncbi:MAG: manganese efflux pump MntP family protein [Fibrobacterales bacterium]
MDIFSLVLISLSLSMDSFAVSVSNGLNFPHLKRKVLITTAASFALCQGLMPYLGWLLGREVAPYIESFDNWIAFGLLAIIGLKMVYESFSSDTDTVKNLKVSTVLLQSIATSIDAFAIGIGFAVIQVDIYWAVILITGITFIFSLLGLKIGRLIGNKIGHNAELAGGVLLILIGFKLLFEV